MSGFGIEVRSDAITEAKRRERFRNVEKMLLQNEKAFLRAKIALTMPKSNNPLPVLPTEIRDKIMASTQYENIPVETSQKILKELVGESKFGDLLILAQLIEFPILQTMQQFINLLKLDPTPILDGMRHCKCILDKFKEIPEYDSTGEYDGFMIASQSCIDSEKTFEMKQFDMDLRKNLVMLLNSDYDPEYFVEMRNNHWYLFNDTIFVILNDLLKINKQKTGHRIFIKNLNLLEWNLRELNGEDISSISDMRGRIQEFQQGVQQGFQQGGRRSRKKNNRNKKCVKTGKHSRRGKHSRCK